MEETTEGKELIFSLSYIFLASFDTEAQEAPINLKKQPLTKTVGVLIEILFITQRVSPCNIMSYPEKCSVLNSTKPGKLVVDHINSQPPPERDC